MQIIKNSSLENVEQFRDNSGDLCTIRTGKTYKITTIQNGTQQNIHPCALVSDLNVVLSELVGDIVLADKELLESKKNENDLATTLAQIVEQGYISQDVVIKILDDVRQKNKNDLNSKHVK